MRKWTQLDRVVLFCICVVLGSVYAVTATTYYVDATGGLDGNNGRSEGSAWRTLAAVNSRSFGAGDKVLLKRGEVWREQLVLDSSGSSSLPLVLGAYGSGALPEINGSDEITGWRVHSGNVWVADVAHGVNQLFIDGVRQPCARWPNSGWASIDADAPAGTSLYCSDLTQPGDYWAGATAVIKTADYAIETRSITSSSNRTLYWDSEVTRWIREDYGFYIEGKREEADTPGEWAFLAYKLYLCLAPGDSPGAHVIEASQRTIGIELKHAEHDITIRDLHVTKFRGDGIQAYNADRVTIQDCSVTRVHGAGIYFWDWPRNSHGGLKLLRNTIHDTRGDGIRFSGCEGGEIRANIVTDIATWTHSPRRAQGIYVTGRHVEIVGNRVDGVSSVGIYPNTAQHCTVVDNVIKRCMTLLCDGGAFYVGVTMDMDLLVQNNIISDVQGNADGTPWSQPTCVGGIYLDSGPAGVTVAGNIVYDCRSWGLFVHFYASDNTIVNNVFYDCGSGIFFSEKEANGIYNHVVRNNICFDTDYSQSALQILRHSGSTQPVGTFDHNVYYCPTRTHTIVYRPPGGSDRRLTLAEWQAATGQDADSFAQHPNFRDGPGADFHIGFDSPCIDAGVDVGRTEDRDGNPIPAGVAPDIGAYEHCGVRIGASTNDAEENLNNGKVTTTSSDLELGEEANPQLVGLRFEGVAIPRGAVIEEARVQFTVDESGSAAAALVIEAEASDNAGVFAAQTGNLSGRATTRAEVRWVPAAWPTAGAAGPAQCTPDLAPIVQEVVNRPGWQHGNPLVLLIRGSGTRTAESFDGDPTKSAALLVTYRVRSFRAFNDLAWQTDEPRTDITTYTRLEDGPLVDHDSGEPLDAVLTVSDTGNTTTQGANPAPGTEADQVFGGIVGCVGLISRGSTETDLTLTFTNLTESAMRYALVLYGNRAEPAYSNRHTEYRLRGADAFVNASSSGAACAGPGDPAATVDTTDNATAGCVARFTDIAPGADGTFSVCVSDGFPDDVEQLYANALMLEGRDTAGGGLLVPMGAAWRYNDTGTDLGSGWRADDPDYDDAWADGSAPLGYGEPDILTELSYGSDPAEKHPTTYFRKHFFLDGSPPVGAALLLRARYDDGFVAYLNGQEVARRAMPGGTIQYTTLASSHEGDVTEKIDLSAYVEALRDGENVLAVEVHQCIANSSDLVLDMELALDTAGGKHGTVCVASGDTWRYAKGTQEASSPVHAWRDSFDDSRWLEGGMPFGYGDGPYQTTLDDMQGTYMSVFLRRTFDVPEPLFVSALCLDLVYDDGLIVWINGREVIRTNVAGVAGSFVPCDSSAASTLEPAQRSRIALAGGALPALRPTGNVLAVQCFNATLGSSDLTLDVALSALHGPLAMTADADQDGLADAWETAELGGPANGGQDGDPDGDGHCNLEEYVCGTDPNDETEFCRLDTTLSGGDVVVSFFARAAAGSGYENMTRYYALETRPVTGDGAWLPVAGYTQIEGTDETATCCIPAAASAEPGWVRARAWLVEAE